ncbi:MAG: MotA/TolQ/ExbB proton channel family protein [Planctomycetales bacterium]|nr:MotA/TolQ/ExbB proton channel family protein [Planctomycetales bacterium]
MFLAGISLIYAAEYFVPWMVAVGASDSGVATRQDALSILFAGGVPGVVLIVLLVILSIIALALVVEHLLTIQRSVLMPERLAEIVQKHLSASQLNEAIRSCQAQPSSLAAVLHAGLRETPGGWATVEKGMEDALGEQSARLLRKIDYLSVIGNIAPMIGLLGTVIGMIFAFQEVANTQGAARAAELASGIYQALVSTVGGLIVAIPSLAAFAVFRNRVDQLIAETGELAQTAISPLKHRLQSPASQVAPPQS